MAEITLVAHPGRTTGSRSSRRLRSAGQLPAVIYGHGTTPLVVTVDARDLRGALSSAAGANALLALQVGETTHLAMAKELQRHPVKGTLLHADFVIVRRDEVVGAEVSITLVGEAEAVHRGDGVVEQLAFSLAIRALPGDIPATIEVDISGLEIGDTIRVGDLELPDGVEPEADDDQMIVVAQPPQVTGLEEVAEPDQTMPPAEPGGDAAPADG
jgi:large subunit ribosomal protein L25